MTDRLALPIRYRRKVEELLREHLPDAEVWAYGSRVNGQSHEGSDLDLVVRGPGLEPLGAEFGELIEALRESNVPILVQVHDWARLPDSFHREIERNFVVVQKADAPVHWAKARLGSCVVTNERTVTPEKEGWPNVNYLDTGNITENRIDEIKYLVVGQDKIPVRARRKVEVGEIVYSTVRPIQRHYGLLNNVPENLLASTGFTVISGKEDVADTGFVYWLLTQDHIVEYLQTIAENSTSAYPSIRPGDIEAIEFLLPRLSEQRAIAQILTTLDDKIELNRRMNETLEAMARALFKSWFVDFEPVRAKVEGRWRRGESLPGLPAEHYDLFPDQLVDYELGEIPEGWGVIPLDELAQFQNGLALQRFRPAPLEARLPVVKIAQMRTGEANHEEWASASIKSECKVEDGDVLFSWSGSLLIKIWCGGLAALNQHLFKVTSESYPKWFYLQSLYSHLPTFQQIAQDKATTMGHIRRHHLTEALTAVPPQCVIGAVDKYFAPLLRRMVANELASRKLTQSRDTLLPKLISGEIRVPDAERAVKSVT